jgi:membrane-associated phospholipid phosphatase
VAAGLFLLLGWATLPPGRIWALDQLAADGSVLVRSWHPAGLASVYVHRFSDLAMVGGLGLMRLLVIRWIRTRRLPADGAAALILLGGGTLAAEGFKLALPRLLGPCGWPFSFTLGFPSGHTAMALTLGAAPVLLAAPRWRPASAAAAGLLGGTLAYALFRGGFHSPADILGGGFLSLFLALVLAPFCTPKGDEGCSVARSLPALAPLVLGLGWIVSGAILLPALGAAPGIPSALGAYEGGWRLSAGIALTVPGILALALAPSGGRRLIGASLIGALLWAGGDQLLVHRGMPRSLPPAAEMELRLNWLRTVRREVTVIGRSAVWANQGRGLRWPYAAQLPHREARIQRALSALRGSARNGRERAALDAVERDWTGMRDRAEVVVGSIRAGTYTDPRLLDAVQQARIPAEASLVQLHRQVREGSR